MSDVFFIIPLINLPFTYNVIYYFFLFMYFTLFAAFITPEAQLNSFSFCSSIQALLINTNCSMSLKLNNRSETPSLLSGPNDLPRFLLAISASSLASYAESRPTDINTTSMNICNTLAIIFKLSSILLLPEAIYKPFSIGFNSTFLINILVRK